MNNEQKIRAAILRCPKPFRLAFLKGLMSEKGEKCPYKKKGWAAWKKFYNSGKIYKKKYGNYKQGNLF